MCGFPLTGTCRHWCPHAGVAITGVCFHFGHLLALVSPCGHRFPSCRHDLERPVTNSEVIYTFLKKHDITANVLGVRLLYWQSITSFVSLAWLSNKVVDLNFPSNGGNHMTSCLWKFQFSTVFSSKLHLSKYFFILFWPITVHCDVYNIQQVSLNVLDFNITFTQQS